jgi:hypothetical protein
MSGTVPEDSGVGVEHADRGPDLRVHRLALLVLSVATGLWLLAEVVVNVAGSGGTWPVSSFGMFSGREWPVAAYEVVVTTREGRTVTLSASDFRLGSEGQLTSYLEREVIRSRRGLVRPRGSAREALAQLGVVWNRAHTRQSAVFIALLTRIHPVDGGTWSPPRAVVTAPLR